MMSKSTSLSKGSGSTTPEPKTLVSTYTAIGFKRESVVDVLQNSNGTKYGNASPTQNNGSTSSVSFVSPSSRVVSQLSAH